MDTVWEEFYKLILLHKKTKQSPNISCKYFDVHNTMACGKNRNPGVQ